MQQTLGISLEKAYSYSPIPLTWLLSMRSLCVVLLIVAHALKYVGTDNAVSHRDIRVSEREVEQEEDEEHTKERVVVTEEKPEAEQNIPVGQRVEQPEVVPELPALNKHTHKRISNADMLERVRIYMLAHPNSTVRQTGSDLSINPSTANKYMRQVRMIFTE